MGGTVSNDADGAELYRLAAEITNKTTDYSLAFVKRVVFNSYDQLAAEAAIRAHGKPWEVAWADLRKRVDHNLVAFVVKPGLMTPAVSV